MPKGQRTQASSYVTLALVTSYRFPFIAAVTTCAILIVALGFGIYKYIELDRESDTLAQSNVEAHTYIDELRAQISSLEAERTTLASALASEEAKTGYFEKRINEISGTVGTLTKLATTDPELLAKYSKVYFLNENYRPSALALIDTEDRSDPSRPLEIHAKVEPYLDELMEDAADDGVELRIVSAYRSFGAQAALKSAYAVTYGAGANRFSADQGYSEHQLGTTVDFTTPALGNSFTTFGTTPAYEWLLAHAHEYGFILSYPSGNAYYISEPWHWRFVGVELATDLHKKKANFYDLDQREIHTYLASLFD